MRQSFELAFFTAKALNNAPTQMISLMLPDYTSSRDNVCMHRLDLIDISLTLVFRRGQFILLYLSLVHTFLGLMAKGIISQIKRNS